MKILFALLFISLYSCGQVSKSGHVDRVKDSDTFVINGKTIRLADVDGPELNQPYGDSAKLFSERFLKGGTVMITEKEKDKYGRTVAWVYVNGKSLSEQLVVVGYGWAYKGLSPATLVAKMNKARKVKIGMWCCNPMPPFKWRKNIYL